MEKKVFKYRINTATIIFLVALVFYNIGLFFTKRDMNESLIIFVFTILMFVVFIGFRPHKYVVEKKTVSIYYPLWKHKEVNLMDCETICDPVSRWADIATRPHAIELYTDTKKRYCFFPKERVDFVHAIVSSNKRIHCTVKEYTDARRIIEKRERKERKKAEREAKSQGK